MSDSRRSSAPISWALRVLSIFDRPNGYACGLRNPQRTKILAHLTGDNRSTPVELTAVADGVLFDLDSDGSPEKLSWTRLDTDDALLALDRNGNGFIDNGVELFSNVAPQIPSPEPNGFAFLALFDDPDRGGNADGWITAEDEIFRELILWRDANHHGASQPSELQLVSNTAIQGFELSYRESRHRDQFGNEFRLLAPVSLEPLPGEPQLTFAVVVILVQGQ